MVRYKRNMNTQKLIKIIILILVTSLTSCHFKLFKQTKMDSYPIDLEMNCINKIDFDNSDGKSCVFSYFSEYSNLYFFITINKDHLYFETFSENGTIKPNLLFYIENVDSALYKSVFNYFNKEQSYSYFALQKSNSNDKVCMVIDNYKDENLVSGEGDKYPLTRLESKLIINRYIDFLNERFKANLSFDEKSIKPFFYQMCNFDEEINHWKNKFPEIIKHELIY